jgi:hypothetical protein
MTPADLEMSAGEAEGAELEDAPEQADHHPPSPSAAPPGDDPAPSY